jgi:hypothetical protein
VIASDFFMTVVDDDLIVAAVEVLHERVAGDDHVCCLVRS